MNPLNSRAKGQLRRYREIGDTTPDAGIAFLPSSGEWRMKFSFNGEKVQKDFALKEEAMAERARLIQVVIAQESLEGEQSAAPQRKDSQNTLDRLRKYGDLTPEAGIRYAGKLNSWSLRMTFDGITIQRLFPSKEAAMSERARLIQIIIRDGSLESEQMKKHPYEWQFSPLSDAGIRQITRDAVSRECSRDEFISLWESNSDYIRPSRKGLNADSRMRSDIALIWDRVHLSLREIRELRELSQSDLADHLGVPVPVIEEWEKDGCPDCIRLLISEVLDLIKR